MVKAHRPSRYRLLAGAFGLISSTVALAASPEGEGTLEEVIVTAQMRAQDVQDVPIAISVFTPEQLARAGFSDANDLSKIAPGAIVTQDQGTVSVTIRGIGDLSDLSLIHISEPTRLLS